MTARNTKATFGWVTRYMHWIAGILFFGLFVLALWYRDLDYEHQWYEAAPAWHISLGFVLAILVAIRIAWRFYDRLPEPISTNRLAIYAAKAVHLALLVGLIALAVTGYLFATADGRPASFFDIVEIPAIPGLKPYLKGVVAPVHTYTAYAVVALSILHALAAIKHHLVDRDDTLRRIVSGRRTNPPSAT